MKLRRRIAPLKLDPGARQETPLCFDEGAPFRQIQDESGTTGTQAGVGRRRAIDGCGAWIGTPLVSQRVCHVPSPKLNRKMRVRPVAPRTRTAN